MMTEDKGINERSMMTEDEATDERLMRSEVLQQTADRLHKSSRKTREVQGTVRQDYESRSLVDA